METGVDLRQVGIALDFEAPALVVRQMPVEVVHLMQRQQVNKPFH